MIDKSYALSAIEYLKQIKGIVFESGLADVEVQNIERTFGFTFPPDLRLLLQTALPVSNDFPNWRNGPGTPINQAYPPWTLKKCLDWPFEGIRFDIEFSNFWLDEWGSRPSSLDEAFEIAREKVTQAPKLIPIFSHRYIPDEPMLPDNPVFSFYQTDIIYYGIDLPSYLKAEFGVPNPFPTPEIPRAIRFWHKIEEYNNRRVF